MTDRNIGSGYPFEDAYGYSRAVQVGDQVFVSGTTARGMDLDGDAYVQARAILALVEAALTEAGAQIQHVVRTVVYVTDLGFQDAVTRTHGRVFGAIRPDSTLVQVVALISDAACVEIEATAIIAK